MSNISYYGITQVLTVLGQLVPIPPPGFTFYLALCSSTPTVSQTGITIPELTSAGNYARTLITFGAPSGGPPVTASNNTLIYFPVSSAAYSATATAYAICDSSTIGAGDMWYFNTLTAPVTISAINQQVQFPIASITIGLT